MSDRAGDFGTQKQQMNDLEEKYGFAQRLAVLTDEQLVESFNGQVGNCGWGNARAYYLSRLGAELRSRRFDSQIAFNESGSGLRLTPRVKLLANRLVFADDA